MPLNVTSLQSTGIVGIQPTIMHSRLSLLVDLSSMLAKEIDFDALLGAACERLREALRADRATIWLVDAAQRDLVTRIATLPEVALLRQPIDRGIAGYVSRTGEVLRLADACDDPRFDISADRTTGYTTHSMLVAPIREDPESPIRGVVQVLNRIGGTFDSEDERYLIALGHQLGRALALTTLRAADASGPGVTVRGPINRIIGTSPALDAVYHRIGLAAQTDATVLLQGETGTGKGLFARAIHVNSPRGSHPFVTVDCTTLPPQLVESELFGHERGAYTGADRRVIGKVEAAEGGTLFLDEIGELSLEVQAKFLRLLQERCYERVGSRQELHANVRVVCATNRELERLVQEGRFRKDLFYRVRVVDVLIPPLRDRGGREILALAEHFGEMYSQRHRRPIPRFSSELCRRLQSYPWPGNVRELEHWVESAVVLSPSGQIGVELFTNCDSQAMPQQSESSSVSLPVGLSLDEASRRYVQATVQALGGNRSEAARHLGIGRNSVTRILGVTSTKV